LLDMTPGGRGKDWYPKLEYDVPAAVAGRAGSCCHDDTNPAADGGTDAAPTRRA